MSREKLAIEGGPQACPFDWPTWPIHDTTEETALLEVLRSGKWWFGERVRLFEKEFADFQGAQYAVTCTNGTTALEMGLRAIGVVEGDEVIVPCYSFIATATAVITIGAIPVFVDICPTRSASIRKTSNEKSTTRQRPSFPSTSLAERRTCNASTSWRKYTA